MTRALTDRPNAGKDTAAALARAGVGTAGQLEEIGSIEAAMALLRAGGDAYANRPYAIERAIRGHAILREERRRLSDRFVEVRSASDEAIFG